MFNKEIMSEAVNLADKHRKVLHGMPECAFEERETTAYIKKVCAAFPVDLIDIGMETGAVYYLNAGREETVALRADIDALPTEQGPKHLCGHDAHAATLIGAMHYLCAVRDELPFNVLFIFQPAEEGTHGAKAMLDHGIHPPTMYFPLIVHEALMVEPTETETKETLDEAVRIFRDIYDEAVSHPETMHEKPLHTPVRRPDEVLAARSPVIRYAFED